jgi:hypothetical protein
MFLSVGVLASFNYRAHALVFGALVLFVVLGNLWARRKARPSDKRKKLSLRGYPFGVRFREIESPASTTPPSIALWASFRVIAPGVNFVAVKAPAARVALAREPIELLDTFLRIVLALTDGKSYIHEHIISGPAICTKRSVWLRFFPPTRLVEQNLQHQQPRPNHNRTIRQIKHRPLIPLVVKQQKIDYASARHAIPKIP